MIVRFHFTKKLFVERASKTLHIELKLKMQYSLHTNSLTSIYHCRHTSVSYYSSFTKVIEYLRKYNILITTRLSSMI